MAPPPPSKPARNPPAAGNEKETDAKTAQQILDTYGSHITFICTEQSYMFLKALYFSDTPSCTKILATPDPKSQKQLGQRVQNFSFWHWSRVKSRVVRVGSWYKYTAPGNKHMKEILLGTGERELAEAARRDRIWGIGYRAEEAEGYREFWGENLLGRALMGLRERVRDIVGREKEWEVVDWDWDGEIEGVEIAEDVEGEEGVQEVDDE
jgi:ribA/ribD-fused uncharacterized protein